MSRLDDIRADYELLGRLLEQSEGSGAAAIVRERRILGEILDKLEKPKELTLVDELAAKRTKTGTTRPPARRRNSG